jgi:hypothetical protein
MKKFFSSIMILAFNLSLFSQIPQFEWVKGFGGSDIDLGTSMAADPSGNIYITGSFSTSVDFDPGAGVFNLNVPAPAVHSCYISKLDSAGNFQWAKPINSKFAAQGNCVKIDSDGNIYVAGYFQDSTDFDPGAGVFMLPSSTIYPDVFVLKLDDAGNFLWVKAFQGPSREQGYSLDIDPSGNILIAGYFESTVDFDPGPGTYALSSAGTSDVFVTKLNSSGDLLWARRFGASAGDWATEVEVDDDGNVYSCGRFNLTVDFDPGIDSFNLSSPISCSSDLFLSKLDSSGNFVWATYIQQTTAGSYSSGDAIAVAGNDVFVTGAFSGTSDFDPFGSGAVLNSTYYNQFILKLHSDGTFQWVKQITGYGGAGSQGTSIIVDPSGNLITSGSFQDVCDFDPGSAVQTLTSLSSSDDVFISVLDPAGNFLFAENLGSGSYTETCRAMISDQFQNLYLLGEFYDAADFNGALSGGVLSTIGPSYDVFLSKFNYLNATSGISEMKAASLSISPNPSVGNFNIAGLSGCSSIEIFDGRGRKVFHAAQPEPAEQIELKGLKSGVYFLRAVFPDTVLNHKLIIQ